MGDGWDLVTRIPTHSAAGLMQVREPVALRRSTSRVLPDGLSGASRHCTPLGPRHCSRSASASERRPGKRGPASAPTSTSSPSSSAATLRGRRLMAPRPLRVCPAIKWRARVGSGTSPVGRARGRGAGRGFGPRASRSWGRAAAGSCEAETRRAALAALRPTLRPPARARSRHARLGTRPRAPRSQPGLETRLLGARVCDAWRRPPAAGIGLAGPGGWERSCQVSPPSIETVLSRSNRPREVFNRSQVFAC